MSTRTAKKAAKTTSKKAAKKAAPTPTRPSTRGGKARALLVSLTHVDKNKYAGWDGRNGCTGCGIDAQRMADALTQLGYEVTSLADGAATQKAVLKALTKAATVSKPGDTFLFYFSGHGGQMPDYNGDEAPEHGGRPGSDETLVCYDAEVLDDSLDEVWTSFTPGAVIYMLSDSCNSGTNYRLRLTQGPSPMRPLSPRAARKMKAALLHMGGCRDAFSSFGTDSGGAFTTALLEAWNEGHGAANWRDLHEAVCAVIEGQIPQINTYGKKASSLLLAPPLAPWTTAGARATPTADDLTDSVDAGETRPGEIADERAAATHPGARSGAARSPLELPINERQARQVTRWLVTHFGAKLDAAGAGTPFSADLLCAIVCQETAYFWLPLIESLAKKPEFKNDPAGLADLILSRCVLDASGDHPDSPRSAFPKNTAEFRNRYGADFTNLLIEEANKTRALRGFGPRQWVYKGYGIFQYDLQFVREDEDFFRERRWYDLEVCLAKCMAELKSKLAATGGDLWEAVRAYNGSGPRARAYRDKVKQFSVWTKDEISKIPAPRDSAPASSSARRGAAAPASRPRLTQTDLGAKLAPLNLDRELHPLIVVGIRGYYLNSLGQPGVNDRGIYDDAIFIDSADGFASFNGNTDPSKYRPGYGFNDSTKGIAKLKQGVWYAHKIDYHGSRVHGSYRAICQRLGDVTVIRDGNPPYEDTGRFGINIHKGGYQGTSSEGCQTIHPDQWASFINLALDLARRYFAADYDKKVIPYVLLEE